MGEPTASLMAALLAFQEEAPSLKKDSTNPHYKSQFASLDNVMSEVRPLLNKYGLVWLTKPCSDEHGEPALAYRLVHAPTGESEEGVMPLLLAKRDPQGQGSAITYARRYSIVSVLGLVADEDDDGNAATGRSQKSRHNGSRVTAQPAQATERMATAQQRGLINARAAEKGLPPITLANIVNVAGKGEMIDFESQSRAEDWLRRALDRLPGRLVNPILEGIKNAEAENPA